jgi:hypothetical protein
MEKHFNSQFLIFVTLLGVMMVLTTCKQISAPIVTTDLVTVFTSTTATISGNVTSDGGATVTERGVYWSNTYNPVTTGTKLQIGSGTGSFSTILTGLTANTNYYVTAYAINKAGTSYDGQVGFTTSN